MHLARLLREAPAYRLTSGNERLLWDAGCRFDLP